MLLGIDIQQILQNIQQLHRHLTHIVQQLMSLVMLIHKLLVQMEVHLNLSESRKLVLSVHITDSVMQNGLTKSLILLGQNTLPHQEEQLLVTVISQIWLQRVNYNSVTISNYVVQILQVSPQTLVIVTLTKHLALLKLQQQLTVMVWVVRLSKTFTDHQELHMELLKRIPTILSKIQSMNSILGTEIIQLMLQTTHRLLQLMTLMVIFFKEVKCMVTTRLSTSWL